MKRVSGLFLAAVLSSSCGVSSCGAESRGGSNGSARGPSSAVSGLPSAVSGRSQGKDDATRSTDAGSFVTGASTFRGVRFVAVGDTGTGTNEQRKVGSAIAAVCKERGCDFVQLLGDNIYDSGASSVDDPLWQTAFEGPYAAIDLDFWVVLGNHDYGHKGAGTDFGKGKNEVDYSSKSAKWKLPTAFWHKAWSKAGVNVEIFGLDTNMILFGKDGDQRTAMSGWIRASNAEWKIAAGHHPYKSNGPHGNAGAYDTFAGISLPPMNGENVKDFLENHVCGKVDLYLSGHDHSRQWLTQPCNGTELAVSGAGAKATVLGGKNPSLFESLALGFLYVVIEGKTLTAEFIDDSGKTEFTHTITKR